MSLGIDIQDLLVHLGVWTAFAIIFAESGLLVGFFLPGDSLVFTAGLLSSQGHFPLWLLLGGGTLAAILGDNLGYYIGKKYGHRVFNKEESFFFHKENVIKAENFYKKWGPITIIVARFTPIVRTFAPVLAGVGKMYYPTFFLYNIVGAVIWIFGLGILGYYAGGFIDVDKYILPVLVGVIVLSLAAGPMIGLIKRILKKRNV